MPFGICSGSEEFQRRMIEHLKGLNGVKVIVDDILIYGKGENLQEAEKDHDANILQLLERLRKVNIKINPDKIKFKVSQVRYMGHILTSEGLKCDPDKTKTIDEMTTP